MCNWLKLLKQKRELEAKLRAKFEESQQYVTQERVSGFTHPRVPIITHSEQEKIQLFHWGLLPNWTSDITFRKNTLNARIESIHEKPSFKESMSRRCLVLVDGFYEWQWLDSKGKNKQQYLITQPDDQAFAMAGLWNRWINPQTGEALNTFTILTTEANDQMSIIHNSKKRMPMILHPHEERQWLNNQDISFKRDMWLKTEKIGGGNGMGSLF